MQALAESDRVLGRGEGGLGGGGSGGWRTGPGGGGHCHFEGS